MKKIFITICLVVILASSSLIGVLNVNATDASSIPLIPNSNTPGDGAGAQTPAGEGAGAQPVRGEGAGVTPVKTFTLGNPLGNSVTLASLLLSVMQVVTYLAVIFAVFMLIWTGLQYVLARGNSERIKELSKTLGWIVVGIAIVLSARILVSAVINTLSATGTVNTTVIQQAKKAADAL